MKVIREKKKLIVLITVIVLAILIGVVVAVNATGSSGVAKSVTFSEDMDGYYVYFRAVDAAGNKGDWSEAQRIWIDTTSPTISVKEASVEVEEGKENELETYFNIDKNGSSEITNISFIDKSNGDKTVENTSELAVGTHEIEATVEKANGAKATATVIIVMMVAGFTLTFISNGSVYSTITEAKTVSFPEQDPTLTGSTFTGWYYDETRTQQANEGDTLIQNTNLYAGWQSHVLNPNNGENQVNVLGSVGVDGTDTSVLLEEGKMVWEYEGSSEIEKLIIEDAINFYVKTGNSGSNELDFEQCIYTEDNCIKTKKITLGDVRTICGSRDGYFEGIVVVKIYFKDGSVETDNVLIMSHLYQYCLVQGTQIMLGNRTTKPIEDITYDDDLLVWDFDERKFTTAKPLWIMKAQVTPQYYLVKFDNGSELKIVLNHRIFVKERGEFAYPTADEVMTTFTAYGTETKVVSVELIKEKVDYYNLITDYHMNVFANGILTSCRLNNIYPIKDMKFQKDNRELAKMEEYPNIPEDYFRGLRIAEQPKDINRGNAVKHTADLEGYVQRLIKGAKEKEII